MSPAVLILLVLEVVPVLEVALLPEVVLLAGAEGLLFVEDEGVEPPPPPQDIRPIARASAAIRSAILFLLLIPRAEADTASPAAPANGSACFWPLPGTSIGVQPEKSWLALT